MRQEVTQNSNNWSASVAIVPPLISILDAELGNSNKIWTVPDGEVWKMTRACVDYLSSSTVGNRIMVLQEEDDVGNIIQKLTSGITNHAASVNISYCMLQGIFRETSVINGSLQVPIPVDFYIPSGNILRFFDLAAIDATGDDMVVKFQIEKLRV